MIIHSGYRHIYNHFHFTFHGKYFQSVKFTLFNKDIPINLLQPNIFPLKIFIALGAIQTLFYFRHKHAHNDFHSIANSFHSSISKVLAKKKTLSNVSRETFILVKNPGIEHSNSQYSMINIKLHMAQHFHFQKYLRLTYNPDNFSFWI